MSGNSLPRDWIKKHKFGFLAQMSRRQESLLLVKGGYWKLKSLGSWYTDIDVVTEADRLGYLAKLLVKPEGCLDGRNISTKGEEFARDLVRNSPPTQVQSQRREATDTAKRSEPTEAIRRPVLTPEALEVLRTVEEQILADPNCFTLRACCESVPEFKSRAYPDKYPSCGTIACLAGLACLCIAKKKGDDGSNLINRSHSELAAVAATELGLSPGEVNRLFAHWSFDFLQQYRHSASPEERARTAVARIGRFIETGE